MDGYTVLFSPSGIGTTSNIAISKEVIQGGSELNSTPSKWVLHRSSRGGALPLHDQHASQRLPNLFAIRMRSRVWVEECGVFLLKSLVPGLSEYLGALSKCKSSERRALSHRDAEH